MYGVIGRMSTTLGKRDEVVAAIAGGTQDMTGCLSYIIALDPSDETGIWITEVWDSRESHAASLKLPAVQASIAAARPYITGFDSRYETIPVAGVSES